MASPARSDRAQKPNQTDLVRESRTARSEKCASVRLTPGFPMGKIRHGHGLAASLHRLGPAWRRLSI